MLNQHSRIAVPYESHLFNTFYPWLKYYGNLTKAENRERLVSDMLSTDVMQEWSPTVEKQKVLSSIRIYNFGGIVEAIFKPWTEGQGKIRWGEKTPHHLLYWREILEFFPKARFIHMVRDGRDVAISWIRARFGPKTVYSAAKNWVAYLNKVSLLKASLPSQFIHEVRYEDLLENPNVELSKVCGFLGEDFEPEMLEFYKNQSSYKTDAVNLENLKKPLLVNNVQKWRNQMNSTDLRVFEGVSRSELVNYGYELATEGITLSKSEQVYHRYIESPPRKLVAMAKNRKGLVDELIKMRIRLRLYLFDQFRIRLNK